MISICFDACGILFALLRRILTYAETEVVAIFNH